MSLPEELYDVFYVTQLTRGTALENLVAVDRVRIYPNECSQTHRHNQAETVLFIEEGSGIITINNEKKQKETSSVRRSHLHSQRRMA